MKKKENELSKGIFFAAVCFLLFATFLIYGETQAKAASQKEEIKQSIASQLKKKNRVRKIFYADYDNNGRAEAFVLTGPKKKKNEQAEYETQFTLWFAYIENGSVVSKKLRKDALGESGFLKLKSVTLFRALTYCTTSRPEDLYEVVGNEVKVIFHGDCTKAVSGDSFSSVHSTYDFMYDKEIGHKLGHTWKPYFFYYKDGKVYEYKGKKISLARFKKYENGKKMIKKYKKYGEIASIIYRENGLVHVNYKHRYGGDISYSNVTYKVSGNSLIKPVVEEGIYRTKLPEGVWITLPEGVTNLVVKSKKGNKISLSWKKVKSAKGYLIEYADNKTFKKKKCKVTKKTKYVIKKLEKKTTYYIRVRAYKLDDEEQICGNWSKVKEIEVKK